MKNTLLVIFLALAANVFSQVPASTTYFLDSTPIDINTMYINALSIDSIVVQRKGDLEEVHMKSKRLIDYITLDEILEHYTRVDELVNPVVYIVNDKLITSKNNVKIDKSYFLYVKTVDLKDLTYIDKKYKNLVLVRITLSENELKPEVNANDILDILKQ
jgi:hypothetical protein